MKSKSLHSIIITLAIVILGTKLSTHAQNRVENLVPPITDATGIFDDFFALEEFAKQVAETRHLGSDRPEPPRLVDVVGAENATVELDALIATLKSLELPEEFSDGAATPLIAPANVGDFTDETLRKEVGSQLELAAIYLQRLELLPPLIEHVESIENAASKSHEAMNALRTALVHAAENTPEYTVLTTAGYSAILVGESILPRISTVKSTAREKAKQFRITTKERYATAKVTMGVIERLSNEENTRIEALVVKINAEKELIYMGWEEFLQRTAPYTAKGEELKQREIALQNTRNQLEADRAALRVDRDAYSRASRQAFDAGRLVYNNALPGLHRRANDLNRRSADIRARSNELDRISGALAAEMQQHQQQAVAIAEERKQLDERGANWAKSAETAAALKSAIKSDRERLAEMKTNAQQAGTEQPATRPELKSDGSDKPQPDAEGRSR